MSESQRPRFHPRWTRTAFKPFATIFPKDGDPIHARIARLIVLHQDIYLDVKGFAASGSEVAVLDVPEERYRISTSPVDVF